MPESHSRSPVRIAIVGAGAVSDYHHVPAIAMDPRAELAAVCDADPALLEQRRQDWGVDVVSTDYDAICNNPDIDAVIIATPNFTHRPMAVAAAEQMLRSTANALPALLAHTASRISTAPRISATRVSSLRTQPRRRLPRRRSTRW